MRTPAAFVLSCLFAIASVTRAQTIDLASAPRLRIVEEGRIGGSTDPDRGLSALAGVTVDRDGNVYAYDVPAFAIKVFSADGQFLRAIGRQGQGPGEFDSIDAIIGVKGDTLWVRKSGGRGCVSRIMLFKRDGTYLSSTNVPGVPAPVHVDMVGVSQPAEMLDDGRMISGEVTCYTSMRPSPVGGRGGVVSGGSAPPSERATLSDALGQREVNVPRALFDLSTGSIDTIGSFMRRVHPPPLSRPQIMVEGRAQPIPAAPPDDPLGVAFRDGYASIDRSAPSSSAMASIRILRTGIRGDTLANIVLRYEPVGYTSAVLDSIAAQASRSPGAGVLFVNGAPRITPYSNPEAARAAIRAAMKFPDFQMPVTRAFGGADGTIWLRREDRGEATVLWHVLESSGQLRGTLALPRRSTPAWVSGPTLWVTHQGEDDIPWLVRYRIERD